MLNQLTAIVINTDSAYTTANGLITIPRTGVYRLGGFVSILYSRTTRPRESSLDVRYTLNRGNDNEFMGYGTTINNANHNQIITTTLPYPTVSLVAGDRLGISIRTSVSYTIISYFVDSSGCGLQVEFLY